MKPAIILGFTVFLFLLAVVVYLPTLRYDFVLDDSAVIKENRLVAQGVSGIPELLKTHYFAGYDPSLPVQSYRPVPQVVNAIQAAISGISPRAFHLGNLVLYGILSVILFMALKRILRQYPVYVPMIISFLFVIHPVHTEVVANIKSRDEMLGFLFFLVSMLLLFIYLDDKKRWALPVSWVLFFLALASKESMFATLAIIPAALYFFRSFSVRKDLLHTVPYLLVLLIFLLIRSGIIAETVARSGEEGNPLIDARNFSESAGTVLMMTGKYFLTAIAPVSLAGDYSYRSFQLVGITHPYALGGLLTSAMLVYMMMRGLRTKGPYSFSIFFFFAALVFVAYVLVSGHNFYADRFLFTPSLAVCLVIGFAVHDLAGSGASGIHRLKPRPRVIVVGAFLFVISALALVRINTYLPTWKDNVSLFEYCVRKFPENARMRKSLGGEYTRMAIHQKDTSAQRILSMKAIRELQASIEIYPRQVTTYIHLGNNFILQRKYSQAEEVLKQALKYDSRNRFTRKSLANVSYRQRKYKEAVYYYESIDPKFMTGEDFRFLAKSCELTGDMEKASKYMALSELKR